MYCYEEIPQIYKFCKEKLDYYYELNKFRKKLKAHKITSDSFTYAEQQYKQHLEAANKIEYEFYFNKDHSKKKNLKKLAEIIRDIDNLSNNPTLSILIYFMEKFVLYDTKTN